MLKNLTLLAVAGLLVNTGCVITTNGTDTNASSATNVSASAGTDTDTGTGTGTDSTTGTGTDTSGTGTDTNPTTGAPTTGTPTTGTSEGTTDTTSDTTTETTGTGFGNCGWNADAKYYACGFEGEDPDGISPIACPDELPNVDDPCDANSPVDNVGCCTPEGVNWYCTNTENGVIVAEEC